MQIIMGNIFQFCLYLGKLGQELGIMMESLFPNSLNSLSEVKGEHSWLLRVA